MKLLQVTETEVEGLAEHFDRSEHFRAERLAPEVRGGSSRVRLPDGSVDEFDAAYVRPPPDKPVYGRIVLESLAEEGLNLNNSSIAFFVMSKKNYLSYVLHDKGVRHPRCEVIASEKTSRSATDTLEFPVIAQRFHDMALSEERLLEEVEDLEEFVSGTEYTEDILLLKEYVDGEKYRVFYCGEPQVSLQDTSDGWKVSGEDLRYSKLSSSQREEVERAMSAIGARYGEVVLRGETVVDVQPAPDLEMYKETGGRDATSAVAKLLMGEMG